MPAKMEDVARRAGVSTATVSRVLNNPAMVSASARQRVLHAIGELDYKVNLAARSLRTNQTRAVAVVIPSLSEPVINQVVEAIEDVAITEGYSLLLCSTRGDAAREVAYIELLAQQAAVDGVLYVSPRAAPGDVAKMLTGGAPVVLCNYVLPGASAPSVTIDHASASYQATRYLIGLGHQRIALLSLAHRYYYPARMRREGFERALAESGMTPEPDLIVALEQATYATDDWRGAIDSLFEGAAPPTAVVAFNDAVALQVYEVCRARGLRIPQDVSVTGCDDILTGRYVEPPLTTVRVPGAELGQRAMRALLALLHNPDTAIPDTARLNVELVVRSSCAPWRGRRR